MNRTKFVSSYTHDNLRHSNRLLINVLIHALFILCLLALSLNLAASHLTQNESLLGIASGVSNELRGLDDEVLDELLVAGGVSNELSPLFNTGHNMLLDAMGIAGVSNELKDLPRALSLASSVSNELARV
ncbi:MAG: hypothetical protein AAF702_02020 [Chloroflexota bacterium]